LKQIEKCGIICEYNPFHNGHAYHLKKTKELLGKDVTIACVMSGDFVQRASPAFFDKRLRAQAAVEAGADCVLELPFLYATNGAARFSYGAMKILSHITNIKWLSFGVEGDVSIDLLNSIVEVQINEGVKLKENLSRFLKEGNSFALAKARATACEFDDEAGILDILNKPNNVLAIEYLIAIQRLKLDITPLLIKRTDGGYNSLELKPPFASASAIRRLIDGSLPFDNFVPKFVSDNFKNMQVDFKLFDGLARLSLLNYNGDNIALKKLRESAQKHKDLDAIILNVKTKNMTYASLKRLILHVMCDVTYDLCDYTGEFFTKLLFMKKSFAKHLGDFSSNILISSDDEKRVFECTKNEAVAIYKTDTSASNIYSVISRQNSKRYFDKVF